MSDDAVDTLGEDWQRQIREASPRRVPMDFPSDEQRRLMDVLLRITDIAGQTFDALERNELSERELMVMLQLPAYCNQFTRGIRAHLARRAAEWRT